MERLLGAVAEAGIDMHDLTRRVQSGELSEEDAARIITDQISRRTE
jgi:hypothetical protein